MKKTLVALAVLAAAGSVNAAEVYNNDGVSVSVSGAGEVQYYQDYEADGDDVSSKIRIDDAQVNVMVGVEVTEDLTAVAGLKQTFESDDNATGTVSTDGSYVGLASAQFGTLTFGRQYLITDDSGIGADFEVGAAQYGQDVTIGSDVIKYVYDNGQYYFGLSHDLDEGEGSTADETSTDGRFGFRMGGLDARLYIYSGESVSLGNDLLGTSYGTGDEDSYNLEAVYTFNDQWSMAASFGNENKDVNNAEVSDRKVFEVVGSYAVDKNTFSLGYVYANEDEGTNAGESNNIYGVVVHQLNANVRAYAELGYYDVDLDTAADPDFDVAYTVGMEVSF
ncbi:porin [Vibrio viridaestus]|nr:porin [Vibrio viridaestus]